ncbi:uncharacterized protein LOC142330463 isoform X2 [Lycorma delicatula]|uniref:uncharacterized protein LOC142330463 isoform X2 n=1 Tax=Lycorma delicatula TaxID=130591 RepID=UPI003F515239
MFSWTYWLRIRPRIMIDISNRDCSATVLGYKIKYPIGVSPTAMQKMAHPEGECANARAVGAFGSIFTLSTLSTSSIEEVAKAAPNTNKWFQLYIYKDRDVTREMVLRAEKAGFKALVLTVDASVFGTRYADVRNKFHLPAHLRLANFEGLKSNKINHAEQNSGLTEYVNKLFDSSLSWKDIKWLKDITKLPLVLKGILTPEDAIIAADLGVAAILVSNHGARQLDTVPASIEALPEIATAVGNRCEIYLDGGIRYGTDVFKALALGAKMVFVGRPAVWGLTHSGEEGVTNVLNILGREFDETLALTGCKSVSDIKKSMVVHESTYSKL